MVHVAGMCDVDLGTRHVHDALYVFQMAHNLLLFYQIAQEGNTIECTSKLVLIQKDIRELIIVGLVDHQSKVYTFSHFYHDDDPYVPNSPDSKVDSNSYDNNGGWLNLALICMVPSSHIVDLVQQDIFSFLDLGLHDGFVLGIANLATSIGLEDMLEGNTLFFENYTLEGMSLHI